MATDLGKLGVWSWLDGYSASEAAEFAQRIEGWGYGALWIPEAVGREPFSLIGYLAAKTERLVLATGIANIYARDAMTTKSILKTLAELAPRRFVMGLGVSHGHLVAGVRGHVYSNKPVSTMRAYLENIEKRALHGPRAGGGRADRARRAAHEHAEALGREGRPAPIPISCRRSTRPRPARRSVPGRLALPRAEGAPRNGSDQGARQAAREAMAGLPRACRTIRTT